MKIATIFTFIILYLLYPLGTNADWYPLRHTGNGKVVPGGNLTASVRKNPPNISIFSADNNALEMTVRLYGFEANKTNIKGVDYSALDLLSENTLSGNTGEPEMPCITKLIAIPEQAEISVEILNTGETFSFTGFNPLPVRESWTEGTEPTEYIPDKEIYDSPGLFPDNIVELSPLGKFRDFRIARLTVYPLRFNLKNKEILATASITFRINFRYPKNYDSRTQAKPKKYISPSFDALYRSIIFNYEEAVKIMDFTVENSYDVLLCIVPDEFDSIFRPYAEWKKRSGYFTKVVKFSEIGANEQDPGIIRDYISKAYHEWEHPPTYVLLVGDYGICPIKYSSYPDYTLINENFFVAVDGDDYFPDLLLGRIPASNDYKLQVMLNKFFKYESNPYTQETSWFKQGTVCSNCNYESQVETKRYTARVMKEDGGFFSVDTLMSDAKRDTVTGAYKDCTVKLQDILDSLNKGRSFLNYRGEAWTDGWNAICYTFHTPDLATLNNGEKLTFVTNIGCGVSRFDRSDGNCFAEEWLTMGSIDNIRGACAFIGPTSNSKTTYNNYIDKGIYIGMFREGLETPAQALFRGKANMTAFFGTDDRWVKYFYELYCTLGDPSIHIWKDIPLQISVSKPDNYPVGYIQPQFTVTYTATGKPAVNAQVTISGDDIFITGFTDSDGKIILPIFTDSEITLNLTVRGGNIIPYIGTIETKYQTVYVYPFGEPAVDDIGGNNDGYGNPGEDCSISFLLKNSGTQTAQNVKAILLSKDTAMANILTVDPVNAGNILPGSQGSQVTFNFSINESCQVGSEIPFELQVSDDKSQWNYNVYQVVEGCDFTFMDSYVEVIQHTFTNRRFDPGETASLSVAVKNIGSDGAENLSGILTSADSNIVILDSLGTFGSVSPGITSINDEDYFIIKALDSCPNNHTSQLCLNLINSDGSYPYSKKLVFKIDVGKSDWTDPTGPDNYGYYIYSSDVDTLYTSCPIYEWVEIKDVGERLVFSNHQYLDVIDLPFDFYYYGKRVWTTTVCLSGWLAFGIVGASSAYDANNKLPYKDKVRGMVAVCWKSLWDGISEDNYDGIYYYFDSLKHRFIIEWKDIEQNDSDYPYINTYEAILLDPAFYHTATGDGEIIVNYKLIEYNTKSTIGIENLTEDDGIVYSYNGVFDITGSWIYDSTAIKFTTEKPRAWTSVGDNEYGSRNFTEGFYLEQNYPNPFNPSTTIPYTLTKPGRVRIMINDLNGNRIRTFQREFQDAGKYYVLWDGKDNYGNSVDSGVYYYCLEFDGTKVQIRKLLYVK